MLKYVPALVSIFKRFEDLIAWQKARELAREVYQVTGAGKLAHDFGLKEQLQRAADSIMANIAEGFERGSAADFHQFLRRRAYLQRSQKP